MKRAAMVILIAVLTGLPLVAAAQTSESGSTTRPTPKTIEGPDATALWATLTK